MPAGFLSASVALAFSVAGAGEPSGGGGPDERSRPSRATSGLAREITPQVRVAIDRGLAYLVQNQQSDGSFSGTDGSDGYPVAVDGLAGLAFLSGGYTDKEGPYTTAMARGIANLLQFQRSDGYFDDGRSRMYGHGFATLFLAELYGMTGDLSKTIRGSLTSAVKLIEDSQCEDGGWDYQPEGVRGSDTSITVCQTMALRAARNLGITVKGSVVERARAYIRKAQNTDGGFEYRISGSSLLGDVSTFPRSAAGVCILYTLAKKGDEYSSREIKIGFDYLLQNYRSTNQFMFYGDYYCAQAMFQAGEKYWGEYYPYLREKLVTHQRADGSWTGIGVEVTPQATAMALIALQVPYRLLPIIER